MYMGRSQGSCACFVPAMVFLEHCRQIPWDKDEEKLMAWKEARTGFPWIDAAMTQLKDEGCVFVLGNMRTSRIFQVYPKMIHTDERLSF